jgi:hypothetical protein
MQRFWNWLARDDRFPANVSGQSIKPLHMTSSAKNATLPDAAVNCPDNAK